MQYSGATSADRANLWRKINSTLILRMEDKAWFVAEDRAFRRAVYSGDQETVQRLGAELTTRLREEGIADRLDVLHADGTLAFSSQPAVFQSSVIAPQTGARGNGEARARTRRGQRSGAERGPRPGHPPRRTPRSCRNRRHGRLRDEHRRGDTRNGAGDPVVGSDRESPRPHARRCLGCPVGEPRQAHRRERGRHGADGGNRQSRVLRGGPAAGGRARQPGGAPHQRKGRDRSRAQAGAGESDHRQRGARLPDTGARRSRLLHGPLLRAPDRRGGRPERLVTRRSRCPDRRCRRTGRSRPDCGGRQCISGQSGRVRQIPSFPRASATASGALHPAGNDSARRHAR